MVPVMTPKPKKTRELTPEEIERRAAAKGSIARQTEVDLSRYHTPGGEIIHVALAAQILGLTPRRVRAFIINGRLPAAKVLRHYIVKYSDLMEFGGTPRPSGRPETEESGLGPDHTGFYRKSPDPTP